MGLFRKLVEQALLNEESLDARIARILRQGFETTKKKITTPSVTKPKVKKPSTPTTKKDTKPRKTQAPKRLQRPQDIIPYDAQGRMNIDKVTGMAELMKKNTPWKDIYVWGSKDSKPAWAGFKQPQVFTREGALEVFKPTWQRYNAGSPEEFEEYVDSMLTQLKTADKYEWFTEN